jgi:selenocysteine lyase/cysteine desulfurase
VFAARAGIDLLLAVGIERLHAHVEGLATHCIDGLRERGADVLTPPHPRSRAGVIAVRHAEPQRVFDECRSRAVDIGAIGSVRVDPHGFNTPADIDRFLACWDAAAG